MPDITVQSVQPLSPDWTVEDFLGTAPYEWLYRFKDNKFLLQQMVSKTQMNAKKKKFADFSKMWNAFLESMSPKGTILGDFETGFPDQPLQLNSGKDI